MRNTELLEAAARGWRQPPKLRGGTLADHIERAVEECRTLAYRLEAIAQRARIEEKVFIGERQN